MAFVHVFLFVFGGFALGSVTACAPSKNTVLLSYESGYYVQVKTGSSWGAGTSANVKIQIVGTKGMTSKHDINPKEGYYRNTLEGFPIYDKADIGDVTAVKVYRDTSGSFSPWQLEKIVVKDAKGKESTFPYGKWVQPYKWNSISVQCKENERKMPRTGACIAIQCFPHSGSVTSTTEYTVKVTTGSSLGAGTSANVKIKIVGTRGETSAHHITPHIGYYEGREQNSTIHGKNVGDVTAVKVYRDKSGWFSPWQLDKIAVFSRATAVWAKFGYGHWLPPHAWKELLVICESNQQKKGSKGPCKAKFCPSQ